MSGYSLGKLRWPSSAQHNEISTTQQTLHHTTETCRNITKSPQNNGNKLQHNRQQNDNSEINTTQRKQATTQKLAQHIGIKPQHYEIIKT